jgi:hypothetical protein
MRGQSNPDDRLSAAEPSPWSRHRLGAVLVALGAAVASMAVYRGVLDAYFWNDDFSWFYVLHDRSTAEFLFTPAGGQSHVARNAVLALTDALAGLNPRPYFVATLLTHGLNAALLAALILRLTGRLSLAAIGAMAWGTSPTASESLGWYTDYGQVAAATCILLLFVHLAARIRDAGGLLRRDLAITAVCLGLSTLFFGTGVAVALVFPLAIALLFPDDRFRSVVAVSVGVLALYAVLQGVGSRAYGAPNIPVDVVRQVLRSPARAVTTGVQLVRVGIASLLLGAWWQPPGRADSLAWLVLAGAAAGWVAAFTIAAPQRRRALLAFTLLALAVYALVALARGPASEQLFGTPATEVAATPRYHYTAQAFLAVALCVAIDAIATSRRSALPIRVALGWLAMLAGGALLYPAAIDRHDAARVEVTRALESLHEQVAGSPPGQAVYLRNEPIAAFGWMPNTVTPPPGLAALFVITSPHDEVAGRPVRFIEPDATVVGLFARPGSRMARLLVPSPEPGSTTPGR